MVTHSTTGDLAIDSLCPYCEISKKSKFATGRNVKKKYRNSHQIQQSTELKVQTRQGQKAVLANVAITSNVHISSKNVIVLKTAVGLNTNHMRRT